MVLKPSAGAGNNGGGGAGVLVLRGRLQAVWMVRVD